MTLPDFIMEQRNIIFRKFSVLVVLHSLFKLNAHDAIHVRRQLSMG